MLNGRTREPVNNALDIVDYYISKVGKVPENWDEASKQVEKELLGVKSIEKMFVSPVSASLKKWSSEENVDQTFFPDYYAVWRIDL